ncbi:MAG TPA: hypothetical protein VIF15_11195 [Polyangiaceae bacterium]
MTPGNLELVQVLLSWGVVLPSVFAVTAWDERHLPPDRLARSWPRQSRDAVLFALWLFLHPLYLLLCLLVYCVRTRGWLRGLPLGLLATVVIVALDAVAQLGLEAANDWARMV